MFYYFSDGEDRQSWSSIIDWTR